MNSAAIKKCAFIKIIITGLTCLLFFLKIKVITNSLPILLNSLSHCIGVSGGGGDDDNGHFIERE